MTDRPLPEGSRLFTPDNLQSASVVARRERALLVDFDANRRASVPAKPQESLED